jgi:exonuclease VII small subunit
MADTDNSPSDGAKPPEAEPGAGAKPPGGTPDGATPKGEEGNKPDTPLGDNGIAALEKERDARREAERNVAQLRDRVTELEDAGKSELDRAMSALKRATDDLAKSSARIGELEGELSKRDTDALKAKIAEEEGLPPSVAKRLTGKDARELRADAKALKDELNAGTPVGVIGVGRGGTASGTRRVDMNTLIRDAAGR